MPEMMKALAVYGDQSVKIVEIPKPEPTDYSDYACRVRVIAVGLCNGTDLKIIRNAVADKDIKYPLILGHESVGIIDAIGPKVRNWKVGDRMCCPTGAIARDCGFTNMHGSMAEYAITYDVKACLEDGQPNPAPWLPYNEKDFIGKKIPDNMCFEDAVMLHTFKENYSAIMNFGFQPGMDVLVYGDGPVGCGVCTFLRLLGAGSVVSVGHHEDRIEQMKKIAQPTMTINSKTENVAEKIGDKKFDLCIDCVGSTAVIMEGAKFLKQFGKVGLYGVLTHATANINLTELPNNITLHTLNWPHREHRWHDEICALIDEGKLKLSDYYDTVMTFDHAQEGIDLIAQRKAKKVIFKWDMDAK